MSGFLRSHNTVEELSRAYVISPVPIENRTIERFSLTCYSFVGAFFPLKEEKVINL